MTATELAADEIGEFATAPRNGRQVLAWNGRAWEIVRFDPIAGAWETTYRGRGCELLERVLVRRFTSWAPLRQPVGFVCDGCGRQAPDPEEDLAAIRAAGGLSCCPERDVRPIW